MNLAEYLNKLLAIEQECTNFLTAANEKTEVSDIKNKFLGRKSELTALLRSIVELRPEERGEAGKAANETRTKIESLVNQKLNATPENAEVLDVSLPGDKFSEGHLHLTTQAIKEITKIFEKIGFYKVRYPEVDWDWYAFTSLNFPLNHPARDDWETFFIDKTEQDPKLGKRVLTPHTSSGQVREMQTGRMPIRMINISKTYRRQIDISHTLMFHQFEGLLIDKGITIAHLKGVLDYFVKEFNIKVNHTDDFRKDIYKFSGGNPKIVKELCFMAKDAKYHSCGNCNVRLIDLDHRIGKATGGST